MTTSPEQQALTAKIVSYIQAGYLTPGQDACYLRATAQFEPFTHFQDVAAPLGILTTAGVLIEQSSPVGWKLNPAFVWPKGQPVIYQAGTTPPIGA
jgi:hypothetical protein